MVDSAALVSPDVSTFSSEAHVHVARCILAIARLLALSAANQLDSPEARALARLTSETARAAAAAAGRPTDLLIGRSSLQLHGDALRAPSWVYDAAWSIASRLTPGSFCALHVPASVEPDDVLELARAGAPGPSTRIRSFGLPSRFAALVEAQGREPGIDERLAVIVLGIRKELAAAREKNHGAMQLWTSLAHSVVESCEQNPRWTSLSSPHAFAFDSETWLCADAALLAGCMTITLTSDRRASRDAALAVLLVAARRAWEQGPVAQPGIRQESLQEWVLSARDADRIPPTCLVLLGELDHLVGGDPREGHREHGAESVLARIVESSWWFVHEIDGGEDAVERRHGTQRASAAASEDDGVHALLLACTTPWWTASVPPSEPVVVERAQEAGATPRSRGAALKEGSAKPFTNDELDSFLDEFVAWGEERGG